MAASVSVRASVWLNLPQFGTADFDGKLPKNNPNRFALDECLAAASAANLYSTSAKIRQYPPERHCQNHKNPELKLKANSKLRKFPASLHTSGLKAKRQRA